MSRRVYPRGLALCCLASIPPGTPTEGALLDCTECTAQMIVTGGIWHLNRHLGPDEQDVA